MIHSFQGPPPCRLERRFDETIARHALIAPGDAVLAAVSGGPDSLALLHLLAARAPAWQLRLGIAHLDHGLRAESARDVDFIRGFADRLAVTLHTERIDVRELQRRWRLSLEAAARKARYAFLRQTADRYGYDKVALAHHADDNAETLLLNLLRGSGRLGLAGMPALREGGYIRPLIRATRADIMDYLERCHLSALTDPTNTAMDFLRNRIRHQLIPLLERDYQPGARAVLARSAEVWRDEEDWIEGLIQRTLEQVVLDRPPGRLDLDAAALAALAPAVQRRVVRAGLRLVRNDLRRIGFQHIEAIRGLAARSSDGGPLYLPEGLRVQRQGAALTFRRGGLGRRTEGPIAGGGDYGYRMHACGVLTVPESGLAILLTEVERKAVSDPGGAGPRTAFLDGDAVRFPLTVRNFRPGDRFWPLGAGGTQKLKKFFIDNKVPRGRRRRCPLLVSQGRIVWVAGWRIDHRVRLTPQTRRVLKAELVLAEPTESD